MIMVQAWNRLDRALLLRWPTLWLARIHVVTAAGVVLSLLMCLVGFSLPVQRSRITDTTVAVSWNTASISVPSTIAATATLLLTVYWAYLQLRSKNLVPSFGRRWIFPVYVFCIVVLNLGPFLMLNIYYWRMSQTASLSYPDFLLHTSTYDDMLVPLLLVALVEGVLLALVTAAGTVNGRMILLTAGGTFVSIFLLSGLSALPGTQNFLTAVLLAGYLLVGIISISRPFSHIQLVLASTAVFHLLTPLLPLLVVLFVSAGGQEGSSLDNTEALTILLWTVLGYGVISYPLERRLARLRATPA